MKNKTIFGLIVLILVLVVGGGIFYFYNNKAEDKTLKISGSLVQDLYEGIAYNEKAPVNYNYHTNLKTVLHVNDLSRSLKNYYGYRNMDAKYIKEEANLKVILNENLKSSVESIFGDNSYEPSTFMATTYGDSKYVYEPLKKAYTLSTVQGGGTGPLPKYSLVSATQTSDSIVLIEKSDEWNNDSASYVENVNQYKIVFKENKNSNYVLYSIEKTTK